MKSLLSQREQFSLERLLSPGNIAVIGASQQAGAVGCEVMRNLAQGGFTGGIYPINPKYNGEQSIFFERNNRIRPFSDAIDCLPQDRIDLALIMTPNRTVPGILDSLGKKGVKAAVIITAGFQECGREGVALAQQIETIAKRHGIVLIGPNCLGIANFNPSIRLNATFSRTAPTFGRGAVFSQSGAVGIDLMNRAGRMGLGIGQFVSLGNELQTGSEHLLAYWASDPEIHYIVGYMESGKALAKLRNLAEQVSRKKPVLMLKAGCSQAGSQAAASHTGAMAGNRQAVDTMLLQSGIQRFETIDALFAAVEAFENSVPSKGCRVAVYSNAGGYGVMLADLLEKPENGLHLATFGTETTIRLNALLPETASKNNPVDTTATFPCDDLEAYERGLCAVLSDEGVDACVLSIIPLMGLCAPEIVAIAARAQARFEKPVMVIISAEEELLKQAEQSLESLNLPKIALYKTLEDALIGLDALEKHRLRQLEPEEEPERYPDVKPGEVRRIFDAVHQDKRTSLTTDESLQVLAAYGIPVVPSMLAITLDEAIAAGKTLGYPLVIKLNSKTISHKSDIGAVITGIQDEAQLKQDWAILFSRLQAAGVNAFQPGEGILLQRQVTGGAELIMGAKADPDFGPLLMVGRGGVYTQIDQDFSLRLLPISRRDSRQMLTKLKFYKVLQGYRGQPGCDLTMLETIILRLSQLVAEFPEIEELDINPLLVPFRQKASGIAVDCRVLVKRPAL